MMNLMANNPAVIGPYRCGRGQPLLLIAGPCVIENEELCLSIAAGLKQCLTEHPDGSGMDTTQLEKLFLSLA